LKFENFQNFRKNFFNKKFFSLKISSQSEEDTNSQQQRQGTSKSIKDKINQKKAVLPPKMALIFEAREMMNITVSGEIILGVLIKKIFLKVSKSFLLLVNQLSEVNFF